MKILSVDLHNIQSHPDSHIDFSKNLNVIRAPSDSGKSVIIRGLKFCILNKAGKNIQRKKTKECGVILSGDNVTVGRHRNGTTNGYALDFYKEGTNVNSKEFKSLRKDIPEDVRQVLNLGEINIQEQKDTFFLLNDSPPQVARMLNKVSGFSAIDAVTKKINSEISSIASDIRKTNNDIKTISQIIKDTDWAVQADVELSAIENLQNEISTLDSEIVETQSLLESYQYYKNESNQLLPESITIDFDDVFSLCEDIEIDKQNIMDIQTLVNSFNRMKIEIESIEDIDLSEVKNLIEEITVIDSSMNEINSLLVLYSQQKIKLAIQDDALSLVESKLSKIKICPTCKRPM